MVHNLFVKNSTSIKRKTIFVNDDIKNYLVKNGYCPISKNNNEWIYIYNDKIMSLIEKFEGGDN